VEIQSELGLKYYLLSILALLAFAGNSILCRLALGQHAVDAGSFTSIRLLTGAIVLWILLRTTKKSETESKRKGWAAPVALFLYAIGFSYAYVTLETGTGALILFTAVQITLIAGAIISGKTLLAVEWLGILLAFGGFIYLILPGVHAPPLLGFGLMSVAGVAWGCYTLLGKGSRNPLNDTAMNFARTLPLAGILTLITMCHSHITLEGAILAMLSGGLASGVGYTIWYMALEGITTTQAAVFQLLVPVIAALSGVAFAGEILTKRLVLSSLMILTGILIVIIGRYVFERARTKITS